MASRLGDASSALQDLIKKSVKQREGPPAVYCLYTSRSSMEKDGKIRKWTFGQKYPNMQNKTILMMGQTGSGKTSLINTMVNYYLGVKFDDKVWFEITEEEKRDQTESQTSEITVYEIVSDHKTFSLTIIDTPGFGDTRGIDKDMEIPQNLYNLFLHDTGVKDLDAVCLVLKASENRISDVQHYIFDAVLSLFGKDIGANIVLCIAYSDGLTPTNVLKAVEKEKIPCCHHDENEPVHFLFNNCQSVIQKKTNTKTIKAAWEMGANSLEEFFTFLKSRERRDVAVTVSVLQERIQLEACVQSLQKHIEFFEKKQKELAEVQKKLKENKKQIKKDVNHHFTVTTVSREKVDITGVSVWDRKATSCDVCKRTCHEFGCWRSPTVWWCEIITDGKCKVCGCSYENHTREAKKYVTKKKEETLTFQDLTNKYSNTNSEAVTYDKSAFKSVEKEHGSKLEKEAEMMNLESNLIKLLAETEEKKKNSVKEAYEAVIKLSEIALKPDSAFTVQYLDFLIPRVKEAGEEEWVQKLKALQESAHNKSSAVGYLGKMKNLFSRK